jgi:putative methionine-R-sulfoxide reductase with GAF domain
VVEAVRAARDYRWVGLYEVGSEEIAAVAWTGDDRPAHPRFPRTQGCRRRSGDRKPCRDDVVSDARYLVCSGRAEIIVRCWTRDGRGRGTIDVASDRAARSTIRTSISWGDLSAFAQLPSHGNAK